MAIADRCFTRGPLDSGEEDFQFQMPSALW
jgi:hypothetical protein